MTMQRIATGTEWGKRFGYSRAVRAGNFIAVSGTTAEGVDAAQQTKAALLRVGEVLEDLGASLSQVIRIRIFVVGMTPERATAVADAHASVMGDTQPCLSVIGVERLFSDDILVEIEADAVNM